MPGSSDRGRKPVPRPKGTVFRHGVDDKAFHEKGGTASSSGDDNNVQSDDVSDTELRKVFDELDRNADGTVSRAEMIKALKTSPDVRILLGLPERFRQGSEDHTAFERVYQRFGASHTPPPDGRLVS